MTEERYPSTPELAEKYGKEELEQILAYMESRNLKATAPYQQFKEILRYKLNRNHTSS